MNSTSHYPVFLSLAGKRCVVAGLGEVGLRKLGGLLATDAAGILALDSRPIEKLRPEFLNLLEDERVSYECRAFEEDDARQSFLAFAATSDAVENDRIADLCRRWKTLCNCATAPEEGDFILPATARQGSLCAALSTGGQSPLLARQWRLELEDWLKPREKLVWLMGRLRGPILALGNEHSHNSTIFRKIVESPVPLWLESGEIDRASAWLADALPESLHPELALVFNEFKDVFA